MTIFGYVVGVFFAWYDCWVGFYYDRNRKRLYLCPLPMMVVWVEKR